MMYTNDKFTSKISGMFTIKFVYRALFFKSLLDIVYEVKCLIYYSVLSAFADTSLHYSGKLFSSCSKEVLSNTVHINI